jgi:hypothetical protein
MVGVSKKRGLNRKAGPPVDDDLVLRDFTANEAEPALADRHLLTRRCCIDPLNPSSLLGSTPFDRSGVSGDQGDLVRTRLRTDTISRGSKTDITGT